MAVRLPALRTGRSLLPRNIIFLLLYSFLLEAEPQSLVRPEGFGKLKKNPMISSGIEPATFRLVTAPYVSVTYRCILLSPSSGWKPQIHITQSEHIRTSNILRAVLYGCEPRSHALRGERWGCLRTGCWECLHLRARKKEGAEENCVRSSLKLVILNKYEYYCVNCGW
jgi:hypothetical protein